MADLSKIKVGDRLRFEVTVRESTQKVPAGGNLYYIYINGFPIPSQWIETAKHIPAPKLWTPGQWVTYSVTSEPCSAVDIEECCGYCKPETTTRRGLVCNQVGHSVAVFFKATGLETVFADELEPSEAPE